MNIFANKRKIVIFVLLMISVLLYFNIGNEDKAIKDVGKRSFLMGLSMFPYDYTEKAIKDTKEIVKKNADAVIIPIEKGVPWEEAKDNKPFTEDVNKQISAIVQNIPSNKEVFLTSSPFNGFKDNVADDWNVLGNEKRSGEFTDCKFSEDKVTIAYINYITELTKKTNASVIVYAPEVNLLLENAPNLWPDFEVFCSKVYPELKKKFPDKKFLFSIQLDKYYLKESEQKEKLRGIIKYSDYITVKSFPYAYSKYKKPTELPKNYFSKIRQIDSRRPYAILETSYTAKNLKTTNFNAVGNEKYQKEYLKFVMESATNENSRFICWSISRDYDKLWNIMKENNKNQDNVFEIWKNTGLFDQNGNKRDGFKIWNEYFKRKLVLGN